MSLDNDPTGICDRCYETSCVSCVLLNEEIEKDTAKQEQSKSRKLGLCQFPMTKKGREQVKKFLNWLKCKIGFHVWEHFCENFHGDTGIILTMGWHQCRRCGKSKIDFTYGT